MQMVTVAIQILLWLQVKHFVADYLLQPKWVLAGKGDMARMGGYVHAGVHAIGSIPAYLIGGLGLSSTATLVAAEFVVHYLIDFAKAGLSSRTRTGPDAAMYWAMHGFDQFMHQLTYIGLTVATLWLAEG